MPNAEFGATASASGLLCYSDPLACDADPLNRCGGGANADATPCAPAPGWCSSGLALGFAGLDGGSSQQQWACAASLPAGAAPQGSGLPCYATQAACEAVGADAGCSPLGTPPAASGSGSTHSLYDAATGAPEALRCVKDVAFCAGGEAVVSSSFWTCPTSYQTGAAVNSAGVLCFADEASCTMSGTNACLAPPAAGCAPANASGGACATVGHPWTCLPAAFAAASGGGGSGGDDDAGAKGVVGVPTPRPSVSLPSPPSPPPGGAGYVAAAALSVVLSVACVGGVLAVALRRDAAAAPRRLRGF